MRAVSGTMRLVPHAPGTLAFATYPSTEVDVTKLEGLWLRLRGTLWFLPAVITALAVALSVVTIIIDDLLIATGRARELWFVFGVGAEGVRGVLSSIAGSIVTVTGVVFSITVVALQLASTQFTPRVLRTFIDDRANQVVLGVFTGTFTYSLLILRFVRSESDRVGAFVPSVSVTVAMALALVSVGCLIYFINHIAHSISAATVIDRLTRDAVATALRAFPRQIGESGSAAVLSNPLLASESVAVRTPRTGYLQAVREDALLELADVGPLVVRMEGGVGEFFNSGDVIASVWGVDRSRIGEIERRARAAFELGVEPTTEQDVAAGISRLVDVAVKALSPGINDPTTAVMCLDGISEVLIVLGGREPPDRVRLSRDGKVRLIAVRPEYEALVELAFTRIRHYGSADPTVDAKLLETIERVARRVPPERCHALARAASLVAADAERRIDADEDRARVRRVAEGVLAQLGSRGADSGRVPRVASSAS